MTRAGDSYGAEDDEYRVALTTLPGIRLLGRSPADPSSAGAILLQRETHDVASTIVCDHPARSAAALMASACATTASLIVNG
jgi:hypothetical protein